MPKRKRDRLPNTPETVDEMHGRRLLLMANCCAVIVDFDRYGDGLTVNHDPDRCREPDYDDVHELIAQAVQYVAPGAPVAIVPVSRSAMPLYVGSAN
jgi:hypothetical protein